MKIKTQLNKTADNINLSGSILTINGKSYDLNKLSEYLTETEEIPFPENPPCYIKNNKKIINLKIDIDLQPMFINENDKRYYDKDCNNLIDLSEFSFIIDHWNKPESERRIERLAIKEEYLKTHTKEEWKNKGKN